MNTTMLLSIAMTGFSVAFFHAAIPTHWLPFVMAARTQKWSRPKTLGITALAGAGHVLFTTLLGILIVWLGIELDKKFDELFPILAGGALIVFGLFYIVQQFRGKHGHSHFLARLGGHDHCDVPDPLRVENRLAPLDKANSVSGVVQKAVKTGALRRYSSDRVAILSLLALLTFSPCEGFLPVYLSGVTLGWLGFAILSGILALGTLTGMMLFTFLTLIGMEKLDLSAVQKHEGYIMGFILCVLGAATMFFEH